MVLWFCSWLTSDFKTMKGVLQRCWDHHKIHLYDTALRFVMILWRNLISHSDPFQCELVTVIIYECVSQRSFCWIYLEWVTLHRLCFQVLRFWFHLRTVISLSRVLKYCLTIYLDHSKCYDYIIFHETR